MANPQSNFQEVLSLTYAWANRTDQLLHAELKRLKVEVTEELFNSIRNRVYQSAGGMIGYDLSFLTYGRYRDMGAGRRAKIESQSSNGDLIRGKKRKSRKPAKWYSRVFYGRLNSLNGAISARIAEQSIQSVINSLK